MFRSLSDRTTSLVFIALVLVAAVATPTIGDGLVLVMSPLLVSLFMMLVLTRDGFAAAGWRRLGITRLGIRWWPVTIIATAGVSFAATAGVVALGHAQFSAPAADALPALLSLCATGPILALGEEFGWRGYLQPRLESWMPGWAASLVVGAVWIAWHLPYILFTPFYHTDGDRTLVLVLFSVSVVAFSLLFGLLRRLSGSMWVAVLAHWFHNMTFAWIASSIITTDDPVMLNEYLSGDTGLFVAIGTLAAAIAVALVTRRRTPRVDDASVANERIPVG